MGGSRGLCEVGDSGVCMCACVCGWGLGCVRVGVRACVCVCGESWGLGCVCVCARAGACGRDKAWAKLSQTVEGVVGAAGAALPALLQHTTPGLRMPARALLCLTAFSGPGSHFGPPSAG